MKTKKGMVIVTAIMITGQILWGANPDASAIITTLRQANSEIFSKANLLTPSSNELKKWNDAIASVKSFVTKNSTVLGIKDSDLTKPLATMEKASTDLINAIKLGLPVTDAGKKALESKLSTIQKNMEGDGNKLLNVTFHVDEKKEAQRVLLLAIQFIGEAAINARLETAQSPTSVASSPVISTTAAKQTKNAELDALYKEGSFTYRLTSGKITLAPVEEWYKKSCAAIEKAKSTLTATAYEKYKKDFKESYAQFIEAGLTKASATAMSASEVTRLLKAIEDTYTYKETYAKAFSKIKEKFNIK